MISLEYRPTDEKGKEVAQMKIRNRDCRAIQKLSRDPQWNVRVHDLIIIELLRSGFLLASIVIGLPAKRLVRIISSRAWTRYTMSIQRVCYK